MTESTRNANPICVPHPRNIDVWIPCRCWIPRNELIWLGAAEMDRSIEWSLPFSISNLMDSGLAKWNIIADELHFPSQNLQIGYTFLTSSPSVSCRSNSTHIFRTSMFFSMPYHVIMRKQILLRSFTCAFFCRQIPFARDPIYACPRKPQMRRMSVTMRCYQRNANDA